MRGVAGWAWMIWLGGCGVAFAGGRHEHWKAVKELAPGKLVEVQREGQAGPDACRVVSADDSALTCEVEEDPDSDWDSLAGARLVFPRSAVRNVWLLEPETVERRIWIGMGVGFALGAAFCARGGPGPLFACAGIGALIGALVGANGAPQGFPGWVGPVYSPRRQPSPQLHHRLIYHATAPASP
jgi:hypothetical protein